MLKEKMPEKDGKTGCERGVVRDVTPFFLFIPLLLYANNHANKSDCQDCKNRKSHRYFLFR
jgi:hypothetical protein